MTVPRLRTDEQASDHGRLAGRRVLVTGASGVVGRCVVPDLLREGASVVSISRNVPDRQQTGPHAGRHSRLELDLRARNLPPNEVATITDCIHLAAVLFPVSSATFFHDNIPITRNVVSALVRHAPNLQRFVHVSSLAARGPGASADYNDPYLDARAVSDYGESKYACEDGREITAAGEGACRDPSSRHRPVTRRSPAADDCKKSSMDADVRARATAQRHLGDSG